MSPPRREEIVQPHARTQAERIFKGFRLGFAQRHVDSCHALDLPYFAFRKRMPPEFSNQPIKLSIRDRRQWRRKFVFLVLSHARVYRSHTVSRSAACLRPYGGALTNVTKDRNDCARIVIAGNDVPSHTLRGSLRSHSQGSAGYGQWNTVPAHNEFPARTRTAAAF